MANPNVLVGPIKIFRIGSPKGQKESERKGSYSSAMAWAEAALARVAFEDEPQLLEVFGVRVW